MGRDAGKSSNAHDLGPFVRIRSSAAIPPAPSFVAANGQKQLCARGLSKALLIRAYFWHIDVVILEILTKEPALSWEAIAGLSSAVIALCALGLTIWQAHIARRHNMLSVAPHLTAWRHSDKTNNLFSVELLNNGIGPALIRSFQVQVDGHVIAGEGYEPIEKALKVIFSQYQYSSYQSFVSNGYAMSPNEARPLVTVQFSGERLPQPEEIEHATKRIRILIEYSSMYGEPFVFDTAYRANTSTISDD